MSTELTEVPADAATFAEWHSRFVIPDSAEGKTFQELKVVWKCGDRIVRRYLQDAKKAGILRTGERQISNLAGRRSAVPVYSFVLPKKNGR
jgi:hypothetical protein